MFDVKLRGRVTDIGHVEEFTYKSGDNAGTKGVVRGFTIEELDRYPNELRLSLFGENMAKLEGVNVGDEVAVTGRLRSKSYVRRDGSKGWFMSMPVTSIAVVRRAGEEYGAHDQANMVMPPIKRVQDMVDPFDLPF